MSSKREALPPSSNTGGKSPPVNHQPAHVDALAFSFIQEGFSNADLPALACVLSRFFHGFSLAPAGRGRLGFSHSADVNIGGLVAWGGDNQRNRVFVSLMGVACSLCTDWAGLASWLEESNARISRLDLAHDDLEGARYSVDAALSDYQAGGYTSSGRPPACKFISSGDWGERAARTFYVGKRENGKMVRVYEKGQQLKDTEHPDWVRIEVELRAQDRVIPFDALVNPARYLAAAYPALSWISELKEYIKTARLVVEKTLDQAVEWAQRQCGKVLHAATLFHGGDVFAVFNRIKRAELPRRLAGAQSLLSPQGS